MPELPDITVYIEGLEKRILGHALERAQVNSPFLVRTAAPPISSIEEKRVLELRRLGKRICIGLEGGLWMVLHLMIAGRLHWKQQAVSPAPGRKSPLRAAKNNLAVFHFENGQLSLTEAGTQRRASLHEHLWTTRGSASHYRDFVYPRQPGQTLGRQERSRAAFTRAERRADGCRLHARHATGRHHRLNRTDVALGRAVRQQAA